MGYACSKTMWRSCRAVMNDQPATAEYPEGLTDDEYYTEELPEWEEPPETAAQILARQSAKLQGLKAVANSQKAALTNRISELNDAIEYDVATPDEVAELPIRVAQRKTWGLYAIDLGRVTTQAGWPPDVIWPVQPAEGMDLTVSASAPDLA